jgi:hypothetical protein
MLANVTPRALASTETSIDNKLLLVEASLGLTQATAAEQPKLCRIRYAEGEVHLLKSVIFVLRHFVDSVKVPVKLDGAEIIELAESICRKYTHESLEDIMLALKEARNGKTIFYNKLDQSDVLRALDKYFERKSIWLEHQHRDQKSRATSIEHNAAVLLGQVVPDLCQQMTLRIDPTHPNSESLRRKLSITKAKEQRGLMTPEEAEQSRADVAAANQRKPRTDWQPGRDAQQRMNARNREEGKRYR